MKASEIALWIDGRLVGEDKEVYGIEVPEKAKENQISFLFDEQKLKETKAGVIVSKKEFPYEKEKTFIIVNDPKEAFIIFLNKIFPEPVKKIKGISKNANIGDANIGENVSIGDFCYISDNVKIGSDTIIYPNSFIGYGVKIGKNCIIYPNVTIYDRTEIGNNVIIHSGAVIGSDGFGYMEKDKKRIKIPQVGKVVIEDDVEIGANTTIDRATLGETVIGKGTKIDNLVQVAHNVKIGKNCVVVAQVGIAGSCSIGDNVIIAGQAGIADHITIEDDAIILAQSGVSKSVKKGSIVCGAPALEKERFFRERALISRLDEIIERIKKLENK